MVRTAYTTSIRIVSVDHYMHKPEPKFDTCYAEFKGCDVKQVPVLRLFGSTSDGTHSCVHIHGVFPYLYVPYDGSTTDSLAVDRLMYQLASSLDKAINVSLGNANSTASHVFRIALVKGLPIYGYHRKEHHFLKIYLYNPHLIRKATNLLMNGVILSRVFQTFETHIPYVLQFFIDYNLYGMSFLNVSSCAIHERTGSDSGLQKMSTSEYEIDILATDILNRSSLEEEKRSEYANPGIASIWNDEQARRNILGMDQPEAISLTQSGNVEIITDSDQFYRNILSSKLVSDETLPSTDETFSDNEKRTKPPVSFYPSEVTDKEQLLDASCVQDHKTFSLHGSTSSYDFTFSQIDEERITDMSQNPDATFAEEDHELLDIMKELEENETNQFEDDSLLAPLTQNSRSIIASGVTLGLSQSSCKKLNATLSGDIEKVSPAQPEKNELNQSEQPATEDDTLDSDDEFLLDYTTKLNMSEAGYVQSGNPINALLDDNEDDFLVAGTIPQLDGAHNDVSCVSTKRTRTNGAMVVNTNGVSVNGHGPLSKRIRYSREPNKTAGFQSAKRSLSNGPFAEAHLSETRKKVKTEQIPSCMHNGFAPKKPEKPLKLKELKVRLSKIDLSSYRLPPKESSIKELQRDLSPYDEFRLAREYDLMNNWDPQEGLSCGTRKRGRGRPKRAKTLQKKIKKSSPEPEIEPEIDIVLSQKFQNIIKLSPKVLLKPLSQREMTNLRDKPRKSLEPTFISSGSDVIIISDEESRSSGCHKVSELPEIRMETDLDVNSKLPVSHQIHSEEIPQSNCTSNDNTDNDSDLNIQSFYENTLVFDDFDQIGSSSDDSMINNGLTTTAGSDQTIVITLQEKPPPFGDALKALQDFVIPKIVNQEPFYGNPADVTGKKEIGHVVLSIGGKSLSDLEEFRSVVDGLGSINQIRYEKLRSIYGESLDQILGETSSRPCGGRLKELVASDRPVVIHLAAKPPSKHDAKVWLKAVAAIQKTDTMTVEQDSPIKVKKMGAIMAADSAQDTPNRSQRKIDHESNLNLSSLITDNNQVDCSARKSLVSRIFSMNTVTSPGVFDVGSPVADNSSGNTDRLELMNYSARRKRLRGLRTRLSLSVVSKRLKSVKADSESAVAVEENSEDGTSCVENSFVEEGMDIVNSSQMLSTSQKSENSSCKESDQTTLPHSAEVTLMKQRLLAESPFSSGCLNQSNNSDNISATTQHNNTYGFKVNFENLQKAKATCEYNYLTIMSVEIHVQTRGDLRPNPETDPITGLFYRIHNDVPEDHRRAPSVCGIILKPELDGSGADGKGPSFKYNQCSYAADVVSVKNERELYEKFLMLISFWDPDIFTGYEIEQASWGYIIQRGYVLEMNLMKMLSRVPTAEKVHVSEEEEQDLLEMHEYSAGLKIPGRILLDIWRLMRHEIALTSYSFENVMYHIMHRRVPRHSYKHLTRLWNKPYSKWIVYEYYLERVNGNLELLQQLDLIGRTAELAKLFGIQFYEVLSRGSQFRVESMMMRIAKPRNFVSLSPSIQQRAHMHAPEYLPLILEPNSRFYADPLIVLDFQSLYPSMIIAYNYCFSTCLGRVEHLGKAEPFEFGASQLRLPRKLLQTLLEKNLITFSPCGVAFAKSSVREGILPRMLNEILATRLMVKASMKLHKDNSILQRVLHSRQLGLKLIANVTYGYTAANFSGRMPCVEVGDSVVSKGRETLERAIKMVESSPKWGVKVVYGDTDSLFVLCPGRTKEEAFKIGEEIANAVTKDNPPPVKLKLEKVYQPCILQTKKRYVGYMYESADQDKPVYEAKGIETVRRDGCPVVGKMLEKVLRILFETRDVSKVKQYTCRQFTKILEGRVNLQDFIFAKEFRGENGYKPGACVPALELTRRWKLVDPRREPRRGERVPYVISSGPPLVPLIRLVRSPDELLVDSGLKINANYYISKAIIPPLNRCLLLLGADVNQWYNDLPRKFLILHNTAGKGSSLANELQVPKKSTISQYFSTTSCVADCGNQTHRGVCNQCLRKPQHTVGYVADKINRLERRVELSEKMCKSCCQRTFETACASLDCPVLFVLNRQNREYAQVQYYRDLMEEMF
ncbi:DNA polymerase zeta catalytic subunit [Malaya genurostris]|uniref:DNA polymerase zeta catalytic subunit n=1 Tax=Malaya genurostris TaxID=325434 RepID=UPI0026F3BF47|nr:DNA polymerase zeta catalytic subunit [Malaya genurostris]